MDSMREKIARAIWAAVDLPEYADIAGRNEQFDHMSATVRATFFRQADAVLEAMREPDEGMLANFGIHKTWVKQNWQAMIDAARTKESV